MASVREDLEGVVYAFRENGETVVLSAGDAIPADVQLGSHLVEPEKAAVKPRTARAASAGGANGTSDKK
ncbi:hypothetical protein AB0G00_24090 [Nocardia salmonicida]|uniref:hypothetical protein n=1 Tax=Nocardia salmonicida TaxID=53431 RepID=UPI0033EC92CC